MNEREVRQLIASLVEGLAIGERHLGTLSSEILALRDASLECGSNEFRTAYANRYESDDAKQMRQRSEERAALLVTLAEELRNPEVRRH